jgi:purine/pyrimidine-nucleoside phosphorylase
MIRLNEYFDGNVKSLGFELDGIPYTVGVILAGDYTFSTEKNEYIQVVAGEIKIEPPGGPWRKLKNGQETIIPAKSTFKLKLKNPAAYICAYR